MNTELNKTLKAALKGEAKLDVSKTAFWKAYIAPLQNAQGVIDWKAGQAKAVSGMVYATVSAWFVGETRHLDGVDYDTAALKVAISKTGTAHPARDAALSGIRVKAWRWTEGLHKAESAKARKASGATGSKAPSGKVSLGQKRSAAAKSKAAKGKAGKAAPVAPELSIPQLAEQLQLALLKVAPQARIVQATEVLNRMRTVISEARNELEPKAKPAKSGKAAKARKAAKATPIDKAAIPFGAMANTVPY